MGLGDVVRVGVPVLREVVAGLGTGKRALAELLAALEEELAQPGEEGEEGGIPLATEVRLPMGNLDKPWYEATRRFGGYNFHPERCEDFNLESGGDSDLGEPLVAPFSGVVVSAYDWGGGIGRVVQLLGLMPAGYLTVWAGWHLEELAVRSWDVVRIGQGIGTIGNAEGRYAAHLHNQVCLMNEWGVPEPRTFPSDGRYDWQCPSEFYVAHGVDRDLVKRCTEFDGR